MKLLSYDIELSDVFELGEHEDMEKYAPFHISVAATAIHEGDEQLWYSTNVWISRLSFATASDRR